MKSCKQMDEVSSYLFRLAGDLLIWMGEDALEMVAMTKLTSNPCQPAAFQKLFNVDAWWGSCTGERKYTKASC